MRKKRFQNKVADSRLTLPITIIYSILVWLTAGVISERWWVQFIFFLFSIYLIVELNNKNALIRVYSRIISCSFAVMVLASANLFSSLEGNGVQLCFLAFYTILFRCYQDKKATGWIFYAFLFLGIISIMFVQILYFIPILWLIMLFNIQALSLRTFWASVFGLIIPYCGMATYQLVEDGNIIATFEHFHNLEEFETLAQYSNITVNQILTFAYVILLTIIGMIHYLRTKYNDKIRTRMLFNTFIVIDLFSIIFLILQPQHYDILIRLIIINTCPLIGHFIALTRKWLTNITFYILIILTLALTAFNIWMPSFHF